MISCTRAAPASWLADICREPGRASPSWLSVFALAASPLRQSPGERTSGSFESLLGLFQIGVQLGQSFAILGLDAAALGRACQIRIFARIARLVIAVLHAASMSVLRKMPTRRSSRRWESDRTCGRGQRAQATESAITPRVAASSCSSATSMRNCSWFLVCRLRGERQKARRGQHLVPLSVNLRGQ